MALSGQTTVTTAGTEVRLAADQPCEFAMVKALPTNTGYMYLGNTGADVVASTTGYVLAAGEFVPIETTNLNQWWVDSSVNGEKVCWIIIA